MHESGYIVTSREPFPRQLDINDAMRKKNDASPENNVHHKAKPKDSFSLLYSIQRTESPHVEPSHSIHAPSITLPNITGPGMEPEKKK